MTPCGVGLGWGRGGRGQVWIHTGYHCMCTDLRRGGGRAAGGGVGEWGGGWSNRAKSYKSKVLFLFLFDGGDRNYFLHQLCSLMCGA